jgi:hypothetical protein
VEEEEEVFNLVHTLADLELPAEAVVVVQVIYYQRLAAQVLMDKETQAALDMI